MASALPTQAYCAPTMQQLGLAASSEQSEACPQRCSVSVPWQAASRFDLQLDSHRDDSDTTVQFGACPPLTTTVSQQSLLPLQSLGCRHSSVSEELQAGEHVTVAPPGSAQQTVPPEHGAFGQSMALPIPPLLEPLLDPLELPLPELPELEPLPRPLLVEPDELPELLLPLPPSSPRAPVSSGPPFAQPTA